MGRGFRTFAVLTTVLILTSISGFVIVTVGATSAFQPEPDSFSHTVTYNAGYQVNGTTNATKMLLPYPDAPKFREALKDSSNATVEKPEGWNLSFVQTENGGMLSVSAGKVEPRERYYLGNNTSTPEGSIRAPEDNRLEHQETHDITITVEYNSSLDTHNGLSAEPHIRPRISPVKVECQHRGECFSTNTTAFLNYDAGNQTYSHLTVNLEGRNEWFSLGWTGNHYRQQFWTGVDNRVIGSQNQWITLQGQEEQSVGNYRD